MDAPHLMHVWDDYMPGAFIEPHRYMHHLSDWNSEVLAARGLNVEDCRLPRVNYLRVENRDQDGPNDLWRRVKGKIRRTLRENQYDKFCRQQLEQKSPDLVHLHFGTTAARLYPVFEAAKRKVVSFYGVDASAAFFDPKMVKRYQRMFKGYDIFIVLSEIVKERLVAHGCPAEKIRVWNIPAGIEIYPYRERQRIEGQTRFIMCARFVGKKGYPYLLEAFRKYLDQGHHGTLTVIGYGQDKGAIIDQAERLELGDRFNLIDSEAKPTFKQIYNEQLSESDVFVLPSTTGKDGDDEGGPALTMICAQASGLPVVCTPFVGAEISMEDGKTGFYCEVDNADDLSQKMIAISKQRDRWETMGKLGSDLVYSEFSLDSQMEKLQDIYREVLGLPVGHA